MVLPQPLEVLLDFLVFLAELHDRQPVRVELYLHLNECLEGALDAIDDDLLGLRLLHHRLHNIFQGGLGRDLDVLVAELPAVLHHQGRADCQAQRHQQRRRGVCRELHLYYALFNRGSDLSIPQTLSVNLLFLANTFCKFKGQE